MPSFGELMQDRNFLSMLAGMGTRFGRGGAGEAIGVPTQQLIQSLATQEAVGKQEAEKKKFNEQLIAILGGLTPKDMPGPTSMKIGADNMTLDITPPTAGAPAGVAGAGVAAGPVVDVAPEKVKTTPAGRLDMSSILPF